MAEHRRVPAAAFQDEQAVRKLLGFDDLRLGLLRRKGQRAGGEQEGERTGACHVRHRNVIVGGPLAVLGGRLYHGQLVPADAMCHAIGQASLPIGR